MRDKSTGRDCDPIFVPRKAEAFSIGPNSSIRKVQRWFDRGGGMPAVKAPERPQGLYRVKPPRAAASYRAARRAAELAARREAKRARPMQRADAA